MRPRLDDGLDRVPHRDARFVELYLKGQLLLDEIISARRPLEEINLCFDEMRAGSAARSVIVFE
jgi:S-(hydroxymethyl)glutathione dehydrogenase/alcohol dehydrogenase